ncbi:MAG TPA: LytR C-terminal domain-containing protein [Streptosporangiaceae bacterium]|nr:LytR C-terminal domain-containing protein [Streptosporangiaceae bacterium]
MGILERHRRGRVVVAGLIALGVAAALLASWWWGRGPGRATGARSVPGAHDRVVVEVLNPTPVVGLARAATRLLRDAGLDVVYFGSDTGRVGDSTQVLVRRGDLAAGTRVARALGVRAVRQAPDAGRLVDVTVRLGRDLAARLAAQNP